MSCCNKNKKINIQTTENNDTNKQNIPKSFVKSSRLPAGTIIRTCNTCFTRNTGKECIVCGSPLF